LRDVPIRDTGVEMIRGSVQDVETVRGAMEGVDTVYHLAANPNLWERQKSKFEMVNLHGTRIVLAEAERANVRRIVYGSTESTLKSARRSNALPITEAWTDLDIDDMAGPYCRSKFLAENEARRAAERGQPVIIVNPTMPVGPGDHLLTPPTRMLLLFLNGGVPAYFDCAMNLIDVRDAALGFILAAERGRPSERYLLGGENLRLSQLLDMIHEATGLSTPKLQVPYWLAYAIGAISELISDHITGKPPLAPLNGVRLARTPLAVDCSKAIDEHGLPQRPIIGALADAISWLEDQGLVTRRSPSLIAAAEAIADR
jgi:dihydroflavonol-4-reductase